MPTKEFANMSESELSYLIAKISETVISQNQTKTCDSHGDLVRAITRLTDIYTQVDNKLAALDTSVTTLIEQMTKVEKALLAAAIEKNIKKELEKDVKAQKQMAPALIVGLATVGATILQALITTAPSMLTAIAAWFKP